MKKILFVAVLLAACSAVGQYRASYSNPVTDVTTTIKIGTINAWKPTTGVCQQGSLSVSTEGNTWCVGTDHAVYKAAAKYPSTWIRHPEMGASVVALAVANDSTIYSLQASSQCPGQYGIFAWANSWIQRAGCLVQLYVGTDGTLTGVNNAQYSFYSSNGGSTWTTWASAWSFVSVWDLANGCAISGNTVYEVSTGNPAVSLGSPSSHQLIGCLSFPLDNDAHITWDSSAHIFYEDDGNWYQTAGSASQIAGGSKAYISALDSSGNTYHLNVYAGSLTQTITGNYANWSGMNPATHPNHTVKSALNFPSDHNLNPNSGHSQTAPYNSNFNVSSWDGNYYCNPFDEEHDPECTPIDNGSESCSQGGFIGNPSPPSPSRMISHWYINRDYLYQNYQDPPVYTAGDMRWHITVHVYVQDDCYGGTPTCRLPDQAGNGVWDLRETYSSRSLPVAKAGAGVLQNYPGPWLVKSIYVTSVGAASCVKLSVDPVIVSDVCD